ncbi:hypothetical protein MSAN_01112200 [Mycena sanguinolenta]|uniref:Uncharacterized protein n=1 Tax=Mycena sanguinolenta TaxID=230812 RepID=A0A8H6YM54_9AGAR|nr:hypothetical protein MSAN_01112200 [Mycena sanguinolenta]
MADAADPNLPTEPALREWKLADKSDQLGRDIRNYVRAELMQKFQEKKATLEQERKNASSSKDKQLNLKDYVDKELFPELNKKFRVEDHYMVAKFTQTLYSMLNSKANYSNNKAAPATQTAGTDTSVASTDTPRYRSKTAQDLYKLQNKEAIETEAKRRLAGKEVSRGDMMRMVQTVGNERFASASPEVKSEMEELAHQKNEAAKEERESPEAVAKHLSQNRVNFNNIVLHALQSLIGVGPTQVGAAVFRVSGAYKDDDGKIHEFTGSVGAADNARGLTDYPSKNAEQNRRTFKEWAKTNLYTLVDIDDDTGEVSLPNVDVNRLGKKEIVAMLLALFSPPAAHQEAEQDDLRAYFKYALECQEKGEAPAKEFQVEEADDANLDDTQDDVNTDGANPDTGKAGGATTDNATLDGEEGATPEDANLDGGKAGGTSGDDANLEGGKAGGTTPDGATPDGASPDGGQAGGATASDASLHGEKDGGAKPDGPNPDDGKPRKAKKAKRDFSAPWVPAHPASPMSSLSELSSDNDGAPPKSGAQGGKKGRSSRRGAAGRGRGRGRGGRARGGLRGDSHAVGRSHQDVVAEEQNESGGRKRKNSEATGEEEEAEGPLKRCKSTAGGKRKRTDDDTEDQEEDDDMHAEKKQRLPLPARRLRSNAPPTRPKTPPFRGFKKPGVVGWVYEKLLPSKSEESEGAGEM